LDWPLVPSLLVVREGNCWRIIWEGVEGMEREGRAVEGGNGRSVKGRNGGEE